MPQTVFLSYAFEDNLDSHIEDRGWVDVFESALSRELAERRLDCKLWRDNRIVDPIPPVGKNVLNAILESHVFVAIVSPHYLESDYCRGELEAFVATHGTADGSGAGPIIKVLKNDPLESGQPEAIRDMAGVAFYRFAAETNTEVPFYEGHGDPQDSDYLQAVSQIASAIEMLLAGAPQSGKAPAKVTRASKRERDPSKTVSVAGAQADKAGRRTGKAAAASDQVFVCYARDDKEFVLALAGKLRDAGIAPWLDLWNIPPGADWDEAIDEVLDASLKLLLVLSPASIASLEVKGELLTALEQDKDIFPVVHKECRIPRQLRTVQRVTMPSVAFDEAVLEQLCAALKGRQ